MKHILAAVSAGVCALALLVASPSAGFAGSGHGQKGHYGQKQYAGHGRQGGHGHGYRNYKRRHHGRNYRRYRRHGHGPNFLFGFSYYSNGPYYGRSYGDSGYYYQPRTVYVDPPVRYVEQPGQYFEPKPVYAAPAIEPPLEGCRMTREYQTQITVGGRLVDAYGDACLMADGSWRRGAPKVAPE